MEEETHIKTISHGDESQNILSPYYLHPGESPGMVLASPPLNANNYHTWSKGMFSALWSKNKLKFIDGTQPEYLAMTIIPFGRLTCIGLIA